MAGHTIRSIKIVDAESELSCFDEAFRKEIIDALKTLDTNKDGEITAQEADKDGDGFVDYKRMTSWDSFKATWAHAILWGQGPKGACRPPDRDLSGDVRAYMIRQQNGNFQAEVDVVKKLGLVRIEEFVLFKSEAGQIAAFERMMKAHRDQNSAFKLSAADFEMLLDQAVSEKVKKAITQARDECGCVR